MKAYVYFSVHEELFQRVAERLAPHGVDSFSGFTWSRHQAKAIAGCGVTIDPMVVFTRDLLPGADDGKPPDLAWLEQRERELGISIQRMLSAERHLLQGRTYEQIMRMAEVALREIAAAYDRIRPDFVLADDVSCFHSYVHYVLARERGIPYWRVSSGRLNYRIAVYSEGFQRSEQVEAAYREIRSRGLSDAERQQAEQFVDEFRQRPTRPTGMATRAKQVGIDRADLGTFKTALRLFLGDRDNPTAIPPHRVIRQRLERIVRVRMTTLRGLFEQPVPGERFVLYPIHFQPEASTLVQAPLYLDQVALLEDIAKSLPAGHRLYVKEHLSNRGRRPLSFYEAIRKIPSVRLLGPDANTWELIANASAIAVITGTMGWEGLLFDKPVVAFGDVFYNILPHVYRGDELPKDRWYELFQRAITSHKPDRQALLAYVAALHRGTYPGFLRNPRTFPEVMADENVTNIVNAIVDAVGLHAGREIRHAR